MPLLYTEAILWKETGLMFKYHPNSFSFDFAVINGETDRDTNSSKAVITRLGFDAGDWAFGISGKNKTGEALNDIRYTTIMRG